MTSRGDFMRVVSSLGLLCVALKQLLRGTIFFSATEKDFLQKQNGLEMRDDAAGVAGVMLGKDVRERVSQRIGYSI